MFELISVLPKTALVFIAVIILISIPYLFGPITDFKASSVPNLLMSIGILGTFIGISLGLWEFNPDEIDKSVPKFLEGLKTAFSTSIAGIFFALLIKGKFIYSRGKLEEDIGGPIVNATIDDLANLLKDIQKSLVGDEDSTLLTQLQKIRMEVKDELEELNKGLEEFIKNMAENNSKALIEALEDVMRDFNTKINEQFGDNFKKLNEAVGKILDWQERYRQQMDEMIQQQTKTSKNMEIATNNFQGMMEQAAEFNKIAENLQGLLSNLEYQRQNLESNLKSFAEVAKKAETGLPSIELKVNELTENFSSAIQRNNNEINEHIKQVADRTEKQVSALDKAMSEELTKALEMFGKQLASLSEKFVSDYLPLTEKLQKVVQIANNLKL